MPKYSIIVPIHNEEGNIRNLDAEIREAMRQLGSFEVLYINDGSKDRSLEELKSLTNATVIDLSRNYGQATALDAGFRAAQGEIVISMDGDGQNVPADIGKMLKKLEDENLDVVAGWRKNRKDSGGINLLTRVGRLMRRILIKDVVHDTGCTLRVYRAEVVKRLDIQGEMHRYILAILKWQGARIGEVVVEHRPRIHGKSSYNYSKAIRGFIDLLGIWFIQKFSQRPLHLFGYLSILTFGFAGLAGGWSLYGKLFMGLSLNRNGWFFMAFFFGIAAIMFFGFGIIIDLLIRVHLNNSPVERRYYVRGISQI